MFQPLVELIFLTLPVFLFDVFPFRKIEADDFRKFTSSHSKIVLLSGQGVPRITEVLLTHRAGPIKAPIEVDCNVPSNNVLSKTLQQ